MHSIPYIFEFNTSEFFHTKGHEKCRMLFIYFWAGSIHSEFRTLISIIQINSWCSIRRNIVFYNSSHDIHLQKQANISVFYWDIWNRNVFILSSNNKNSIKSAYNRTLMFFFLNRYLEFLYMMWMEYLKI